MKKLYQTFFYIPKRSSVPTRVFQTRTLLSALTMLVCCAVFTSATLAYFTSSQSSGVSKIQSATVFTTVTAAGDSVNEGTQGIALYSTPLAYEDLHIFLLTAEGTVSVSYCKVSIYDPNTETTKYYYTDYIYRGESLEFSVRAAKDCEISFDSCWGIIPDEAEAIDVISETEAVGLIYDGNVIEISTTPVAIYEMEPNVTMSFYELMEALATYYDVPVEDIWVFNGFDAEEMEIDEETPAAEVLEVGTEVKIPNVIVEESDSDAGVVEDAFTAVDPTLENPPEVLPMPDGSLPVAPDAPAVPEDPDQTEQPAEGEGEDNTTDPGQTGEDGQTPEAPSDLDGESDGEDSGGQQIGNDTDDTNEGAASETNTESVAPEGESAPAESAEESVA